MASVSSPATASAWTTTAGAKQALVPTGTLAAGTLLLVICANSGRTTAQAPTISDNWAGGAGSTWTQVIAATKNASADSMWVFVRDNVVWDPASPGTNGTVTMTPVAGDTGGGLRVFALIAGGRTGLGAVRQSGKQDNVASGTPAVPLGGAALTTNGLIGAVFTGSNVTTNVVEPSTWTESEDVGYNSPTSGIEWVYKSTGFTGSTVTWGGAAASAFCAVAVELDLSMPVLPDIAAATVIAP